MSSPITQLSWVRLVAVADTPANVAQYAGLLLGLRPADLADMGSGPGSPGTLAGIFGYARSNTGNPTQNGLSVSTEWVMSPPIPAPIVESFRVIPGPEGWQLPASRNTYRNTGQALILTHGLPAADALNLLTQLYDAAVREAAARRALGYPVAGT